MFLVMSILFSLVDQAMTGAVTMRPETEGRAVGGAAPP
jgi:hypothetical protein